MHSTEGKVKEDKNTRVYSTKRRVTYVSSSLSSRDRSYSTAQRHSLDIITQFY